MGLDQLVPRLEYCKQVRITPRTARNWVLSGYGPQPRRLGGRVYYLRAEIEAFLAEVENTPSVVA